MASFNGNIDLLALNGAKVLVGIDEKNKVIANLMAEIEQLKAGK